MKRLLVFLSILWASPWTMLGVAIGFFAVLTGGQGLRRGRVLEFHGGILQKLLKLAPIPAGAAAMTLGHVVIARTTADLDRTRAHERVHVGQYERWGPFFVPAYFLSSAYVWMRGRDPYRENPFEKEAFEIAP